LGEDFPSNGVCFFGELGDEKVFAEEGGFVAGLAGGKLGDIDDDLVHCDTSKKWAKVAIDEDLAVFSREGTWVAVAIAEAENGGFGVSFQEGAAVRNSVSGREVIDDGDSGF